MQSATNEIYLLAKLYAIHWKYSVTFIEQV